MSMQHGKATSSWLLITGPTTCGIPSRSDAITVTLAATATLKHDRGDDCATVSAFALECLSSNNFAHRKRRRQPAGPEPLMAP